MPGWDPEQGTGTGMQLWDRNGDAVRFARCRTGRSRPLAQPDPTRPWSRPCGPAGGPVAGRVARPDPPDPTRDGGYADDRHPRPDRTDRPADPADVRDHAADRRSPPGEGPLRRDDQAGGRPRDPLGRPTPDGRPGAVSTTRTLMRSFFSRLPQDLRRDGTGKSAHRVHEIEKLKHPINRGMMRAEGPRRVAVRSAGPRFARPAIPVPSVWWGRDRPV
jgi:hypothetical protein